MASTVHNPATPYVGPIPGSLHDGMQIHVSGVAEAHHNRFLISLQCGGSIDPRSDCALAFNPRFADNQVVRNSLQNGSWGTEERHGSFPFHKGRHFEVTIKVRHDHYKISVDNRHFCDYNHRISFHRVTHISVEQGIRIKHIRFDASTKQTKTEFHFNDQRNTFQPAPSWLPTGGCQLNTSGMGAVGQFIGSVLNEMAHAPPPQQNYGTSAFGALSPSSYPGGPIINPPVPFVQHAGQLYPNKMIFISGIPHSNPSRFTVYLQHGSHHEPRDIAMCLDARFYYGTDRNIVVRNNKMSGEWGAEERHSPYFPFMPNTSFDLIIMIEAYCFKVAVNNQHLFEFNHRVQPSPGTLDHVRVDGDVRLTQVRFQ